MYSDSFLPSYARLHGNRGYGWCALYPDDTPNDWLQIDFGKIIKVCGVATQGDNDGGKWVTEFKLSFSSSGDSWKNYTDTDGVWMVRFRCVLKHWEIYYLGKFSTFSVLQPKNYDCLKFMTFAGDSQSSQE